MHNKKRTLEISVSAYIMSSERLGQKFGSDSEEREVKLSGTTKSKRSANGAGNIRKRSNGSWEARYTIGIDNKTGKQIQKSVYGKTQKEVRQKLSKIISELDEGTYIEPSKMTLSEWLDIWTRDYLGGVAESTAFQYRRKIELYIRPALGKVKLCNLDTNMIQRMYNELGSEHDGKSGLSPKTIKDINGVMHKILQQALLLNYIRINPANACVLPKRVKPEIHPLNDKQLNQFLAAIKGHVHERLYLVFLFTGMREGELLGLKWECVDFSKGTILIDKQLRKSQEKGGKYYFSLPKHDKIRRITPAPYVMHILKEQKEYQEHLKTAAGCAWEDSGLVFTNELGHFISYRTVYDCLKRIVKKLGYPNIRVHDLRHTYAVNSLRAGDDAKTVQENLGHVSAAFTLDVYVHYTDDMRRDSANRMEAFISSIISE